MKTKSTHIIVSITFLLIAFNLNAQNWLTTGNTGTNSKQNFLGTKDSVSLIFRTHNAERMRITNDGKVGIGTQSPTQKLDVHGNINTTGALSFPGGAGATTMYNDGDGFTITVPSDAGMSIQGGTAGALTATGGDGAIFAESGGNTIYSSTGNLFRNISYSSSIYSVGAWGPGVAGFSDSTYGIYGSTSNPNSYAGYFSGGIYSTGNFVASDETLKQNIQDVSSALSIINQLHPKTYQYRQDNDYKLMKLPQGQHYGLISQDVEKVLPNLVKETRFNATEAVPLKQAFDPNHPGKRLNLKPATTGEVINFKALNYTEFIPLLIKGMQEQQQSIEDLKQINQQQQEQINQLKNLIETKLGSTDVSGIQTATLSSAALLQNTPNPYKNSTNISYSLPAKFSSAQIIITDNSGKVLKQVNVTGAGKGSVNIDAASLTSGNYNYSLWIDGRLIDTKQMLLQK